MFDRETLQSKDAEDADRDFNQRQRMLFFAYHLPLWEPASDGAVWHLEQILDAKTGALRCLVAGGSLPRLTEFPETGARRFTAPRNGPRPVPGSGVARSSGAASPWHRAS